MDNSQTLELACQLIRLGQLEPAHREASAVLSAEPDNSKAKGIVALCHLHAGRHDEAQEMARGALALNPCEQGAHYVLAESMFAQRSFSNAEHHIREAMSLRPNYTPFHLLLGKIYLRSNRAKQTTEQADSMLRIDPSNAEAFMLRACARFELEQYDGMLDDLREAVRMQPNNPLARTQIGIYFMQFGEYSLAAEQFREALRINPTLGPAQRLLAKALKAQENAETE